MQVGFKEGQIVKAGDFLAQIDPRPYEAALAQAQGQLAKDTALHAAGAGRSRALRDAEQAGFDRHAAGRGPEVFLVAQDKAAMASDQAQIDTAKLNIAYCRIVSPVSGRVGLRQVDPGNYVQPTDATGIVVITEIEPISVIFSTPEDNLPQITARLNSGATLPVTAFDRANVKQLATGTLTTFDNQIDTTTGTFKLRATFANRDSALFPNQFVNVRLLVDTLTGAVLVPNAAIQLGAERQLRLCRQGRRHRHGAQGEDRPVRRAAYGDRHRPAAGENVVIDGVDRLRDGAKVSVRNNAERRRRKRRRPGAGAGQAPTPASASTARPTGASQRRRAQRLAVTAARGRRRP